MLCRELFDALDRCESILAGSRYLVGNTLTEADVRLFMTLVRFDHVSCMRGGALVHNSSCSLRCCVAWHQHVITWSHLCLISGLALHPHPVLLANGSYTGFSLGFFC